MSALLASPVIPDQDLPNIPETDLKVVARIRAGDDLAAEELVREHSGRMFAVARRIPGNEDDSADAVQEAFIAAFRQLDTFQGAARLATWLHRITVNVCLMKLRSKSRRPSLTSIDDLLPQFDSTNHHVNPPIPWKCSVVEEVAAAETRRHVRVCIERLPQEYREVILLRDIEELDTQQTAEVLGITVGATKVRLHRARQALKTLLDPWFRQG